jgi:hypothetical protein
MDFIEDLNTATMELIKATLDRDKLWTPRGLEDACRVCRQFVMAYDCYRQVQ